MNENKVKDETYHVPVLLAESINGLITDPDGTYMDATYGGGGHSKEILTRLSPSGKLFAFDQDEEAIQQPIDDPRLVIVHSNYRFFENYLRFYKVNPIHGILADIGVSWHQFDAPYRGFSIRFEEEKLDMRMSRSQALDARTVFNQYDEKKLADVLYRYGELKNSRLLAQKLVKYRAEKEIETLADVKAALKTVLHPQHEKSLLVQLFQAVRIEVNDELGALQALLQGSVSMLRPGGRLVIISYHSLEDRLVKNFLRSGNVDGVEEKDLYGNSKAPFRPVQAKPIVPGEDEIKLNPRSRSARMRIGIRQ